MASEQHWPVAAERNSSTLAGKKYGRDLSFVTPKSAALVGQEGHLVRVAAAGNKPSQPRGTAGLRRGMKET